MYRLEGRLGIWWQGLGVGVGERGEEEVDRRQREGEEVGGGQRRW